MTEYVALYLPSGLPQLNWLRDYPGVSEVKVVASKGNVPTQFCVKFLEMTLTMSVMPPDEVSDHLRGFSNYIMSRHLRQKSDQTAAVLERIAQVKTILGCVIEPGLDIHGYMGGLLTSLVTRHHGLMFARDQVFDSNGEPLLEN